MRVGPAVVVALSVVGSSGAAAPPEPAAADPAVVLQRLQAHAKLGVSSPAFAAGAPIPPAYVEASPPIAWSGAAGAKAYAVVVQDPDAPSSTPFVHWLIWNIPGSATSLPKGLPTAAHVPQAPGAVQGRNDAGGFGYYGPHPPPGAPHHYHFQVFALDAPLGLEPQADLDELAAAMNAHVVASGELVGTYQAK